MLWARRTVLLRDGASSLKTLVRLRIQRLLWIYCPGHAGVSGNEPADRLANTADITSGLQLGRAVVLRGLMNFLNMDRPEHHSIDPPERKRSRERNRPTSHPSRARTFCVQPDIYWHCLTYGDVCHVISTYLIPFMALKLLVTALWERTEVLVTAVNTVLAMVAHQGVGHTAAVVSTLEPQAVQVPSVVWTGWGVWRVSPTTADVTAKKLSGGFTVVTLNNPWQRGGWVCWVREDDVRLRLLVSVCGDFTQEISVLLVVTLDETEIKPEGSAVGWRNSSVMHDVVI